MPAKAKPSLSGMMYRETEHEDAEGRKWWVQVPQDCPDDLLSAGIPVGPLDLEERMKAKGIPTELRIALHNQLYTRRLFSLRDTQRRSNELQAAILSALKAAWGLTASTLFAWYYEEGKGG